MSYIRRCDIRNNIASFYLRSFVPRDVLDLGQCSYFFFPLLFFNLLPTFYSMPPHKQSSRGQADKPPKSKVSTRSASKSAPKPRRVLLPKKEASTPSFLDFIEPPPDHNDMNEEPTQVCHSTSCCAYLSNSCMVL